VAVESAAAACGWNVRGQLGVGQPGNAWIPALLPGLKNAVDVAGGGCHSLAITARSACDVDDMTVLASG
jgi:hypothetical protein